MSKPHGRPGPGQNRLLRSLPTASCERILASCKRMELPAQLTVRHTGDPIEHIDFVESGDLSLVVMMEDGRGVESIIAGFEGASGMAALMGEVTSPYEVTVQVPDHTQRIPVATMRRLMDEDSAIRDMVLRYAQVQLTQASRGAACNQLHPVEERLARWLLHVHDWVEDDCLPLTQEFLS